MNAENYLSDKKENYDRGLHFKYQISKFYWTILSYKYCHMIIQSS